MLHFTLTPSKQDKKRFSAQYFIGVKFIGTLGLWKKDALFINYAKMECYFCSIDSKGFISVYL